MSAHAALPGAPRVAGGLLARNTGLNVAGELATVAAALVAVPMIVHALGVERFGVLSLVWIVFANIAIFDLGLGRATIRMVAATLASGDHPMVATIVWTAVTTQVFVAAASALAFAGLAPLFMRFLDLRADLRADADAALYLTAMAIPLVSASTSFAAVLEAGQRFGRVNAVRIPANVATFVTPLVATALGLGLPGVIGFLIAVRVAGLAAFATSALRLVPALRRPVSPRLEIALRLCRFGGWVTVCHVTAPVVLYFDRYVVGALLSLAAVAYYSAPFDMISRLWMISSSVALTLFPAFSALTRTGNLQRSQALLCRSVKFLVLVQCPIVLVLTAYADPLLRFWLGPDFAEHGTVPLRLLGLAWILGAIEPVTASLLDGSGRPDLLAKLYLAWLPVNAVFTWLFVTTMGLPGAALWVATRALLQTMAVLMIAGVLLGLRPLRFAAALAPALSTILGTAVAMAVFAVLDDIGLLRAAILGSLLALFAAAAWRWVLDPGDRQLFGSIGHGARP